MRTGNEPRRLPPKNHPVREQIESTYKWEMIVWWILSLPSMVLIALMVCQEEGVFNLGEWLSPLGLFMSAMLTYWSTVLLAKW